MKINRWIYVPFIIISLYVLQFLFSKGSVSAFELIFITFIAFLLLFIGDAKARNLTGRDDAEIYKVRQHRQLTVLLNYEKTFDVCRKAIDSLNPTKIKIQDAKQGIFKFRTRIKWNSFGDNITVSLKKVNENLTEVEIKTQPFQKILLVGNGESWKYVDDFCRFLKERDAETNQKVLVESVAILDSVYVKPFQKEKVESK